MNRRWPFVLGVSLAAGTFAFIACSFPDVTFSDSEADGGTQPGIDAKADGDGGGGGDASADRTLVDGPKINPDVDPEGGAQDATFIDGSGKVEAGPDAACCDCDKDTFKKGTASCTTPQPDCDDLNTEIRPNAGFVASATWDSDHLPRYDWDCSGTVVKQYVYGLGACAQQLKINGCDARQGGFEGDPACGATGKYIVTCAADSNLLNLSCTETKAETRTQGCR